MTVPVPPPLAAETVNGEALKLQAPAACVTVTGTPPMFKTAVRDVVAVLAATVYLRLAVPLSTPSSGRVTHAAGLLAVHVQPV